MKDFTAASWNIQTLLNTCRHSYLPNFMTFFGIFIVSSWRASSYNKSLDFAPALWLSTVDRQTHVQMARKKIGQIVWQSENDNDDNCEDDIDYSDEDDNPYDAYDNDSEDDIDDDDDSDTASDDDDDDVQNDDDDDVENSDDNDDGDDDGDGDDDADDSAGIPPSMRFPLAKAHRAHTRLTAFQEEKFWRW